jgi:hypothetical protein
MAACRDDGIMPSEIKSMDFPELKYWADWYFIKQRTVVNELNGARAKNGNR